MNTNQIEKSIELKAPLSRVWKAITDHEQFGQWFGVKLDEPFVPGNTSNGQINIPGREPIRWRAVVKKMEHERIFSLTWHPYSIDPKTDYSKEQPTLVEFLLKPTDGGTLLVVRESGFDALPESRRSEAFRKNSEGWAIQLKNIERYVAQK